METLDQIVQAMGQPQPVIQQMHPFNDVQLVAFIAAHAEHTRAPEDAVAWAIEVVIEAIAQMGGGRFQKLLQKRMAPANGLVPGR